MIETLKIKKFKILQHIEISGVPRIVLIGGKNNSGKSSLLEAIYFFYTRRIADVATKHFAFRGIDKLDLHAASLFSPLFYEFEPKNTIEIMINSEKLTISAVKAAQQKIAGKSGTVELSSSQEMLSDSNYALQLTAVKGKKAAAFYESKILIENNEIKNELLKDTEDILPTIMYYNRKWITRVPSLFSKMDEYGRRGEIEEAMRSVEPRLEELSINISGGQNAVYGKLKGLNKKIPVMLMGDGFNNLLSIFLGIASNENGILLIDEIENGLHYSIIAGVWESINRFSKKYNCQVFATTHSYECVLKAALSFEKEPDSFNYIRMAKLDSGEIVPKVFNYNVLGAAIEKDWEVR